MPNMSRPSSISRRLLTTSEVAEILCVSPRTVLNLLARHDLLGVRVGRQWRIANEEVERFISGQNGHVPSTSRPSIPVEPKSVQTSAWLTVTEAAELLLEDVSGLDLQRAKARVSKAANEQRFRTNGRRGRDRRIDRDSFSTWRLEQREKDLAAYD
jgi:excisionase family DNA binding protein